MRVADVPICDGDAGAGDFVAAAGEKAEYARLRFEHAMKRRQATIERVASERAALMRAAAAGGGGAAAAHTNRSGAARPGSAAAASAGRGDGMVERERARLDKIKARRAKEIQQQVRVCVGGGRHRVCKPRHARTRRCCPLALL